MALGTITNIIDRSEITVASAPVEEYDDGPIILAPTFSYKGPEEFGLYNNVQYFKNFGSANFARYGQNSIQIANVLASGARIATKRMVPTDAALANSTITAKITTIEQEEGQPNKVVITLGVTSAVGARSMDSVIESVEATEQPSGTFALFTIADIGRGPSLKKFNLVPLNETSKNMKQMFYQLNVTENDEAAESTKCVMLPDTVINGICYEIGEVVQDTMSQIQAYSYNDQIEKFMEALAIATGKDIEDIKFQDFLFGTTRRGEAWANVTVDIENGVDLSSTDGVPLSNGAFGTYGEYPIKNKDYYNSAVLSFFDGTATPKIYDQRSLRVTAVFDAQWDIPTKEAVVELAEHRKDFMFFRDFGNAITSIDDIREMRSKLTRSTFTCDFAQSYKIIDPYSSKHIGVTAIYDVALKIIPHIINHVSAPFAGALNSASLDSCLPGTLNFEPVKTNKIDEIAQLEDLRVNCAGYYNYGKSLIVESVYTSQEKYTQLSFCNNVMAFQRVVREIRDVCNNVRFVSGSVAIDTYTIAVNEVIDKYIGDFTELSFAYVEDAIALENKIYTGEIHFQFEPFFQAEDFKLYMDKAA